MNKKNFPKISVITPNYNGAEYLEQTILSVLEQNYPNLEYIIIDGGSTDGSVEIIKKYEHKLTYWVSEPDNGLYFAVQKGFNKSSGEIMAWINSDDMFAKGSLSIVSEIFSNINQINWLMGKPSAYDEYNRTTLVHDFKPWSKFNYYTGDYEWIQQESVFWRRSLWERAGSIINTNLKYAADFELWMRFFRYEKLYALNALLGGFRIRSKNQISLEHLKDYRAEVEHVINYELKNELTEQEVAVVNKIKYYRSLAPKAHHIIRFYCNYKVKKMIKKYYNYPQLLYFDRFEQVFKLGGHV